MAGQYSARPLSQELQQLYTALGAVLREYRTQQNLTRRQVADRLGVAETTIAALEVGRRMTLELMLQLCRLYHKKMVPLIETATTRAGLSL